MAKLSFPPEDLARHVATLRERLSAPPDRDIDPFGQLRMLATKNTFDALELLGDSAFARSARVHVAFLLGARLTWDERATIERLRTESHSELQHLPPGANTPQALAKALFSWPDSEVPALYEKLPVAIADLRARHKQVREMRDEIGQRLGQVDVLGLGLSHAILRESARTFLAQTSALAQASRHRATAEHQAHGRPAHERALWTLRDAQLAQTLTPWPARLSPQWLPEVFPHLATPRIDPSTGPRIARALLRTPPARLGGASFMKYLGRFGETLGRTLPETPHEMLLRADPADVGAQTWSTVFTLLGAQTVFHRRALGASQRETAFGVREHASSLLTSAGALALATLAELRVDAREWEESVFGAPLPRGLSGEWPSMQASPHASVLPRFCAFVSAMTEANRLRELFDEDWFRNPKTAEYFLVGLPLAREATDTKSWVQFFEERLS
jgi:hypothetical protein